jgi:outer membrane protein assembly factor BamD
MLHDSPGRPRTPGPAAEPTDWVRVLAPAMLEYRLLRIVVLIALTGAAGCSRGFKLSRYTSNEALFQAAREQFDRRKWDNAVSAFEKLTFDLPARDTLLPLAHWYLARSYVGRDENLLAAQAFNRFAESFATDSLADNAMFEAGQAYQRLWRRPTLDANYGEQAISTYQSLLGLYPESELREETTREINRLQEWFATKDYESGLYYYRRRAFDSAIIYFKDVVANFPQTAKSREAYLRLAESYEAIRYREDKKEVCTTLQERYPADREVASICGPPAAVSTRPKPDSTTPPDTT